MHKLLIHIALPASLLLGGCSSTSDWALGTNIARGLDALPFVYRPTIRQGNIITQEDVDKLQPGMTKRQVRFALGTPMLVDVFHQDRWDYVLVEQVGSRVLEERSTRLYFDDDRLVRIEGDLRPQPAGEGAEPPAQDLVVEVPDWDGDRDTLFGRSLRAIGLRD